MWIKSQALTALALAGHLMSPSLHLLTNVAREKHAGLEELSNGSVLCTSWHGLKVVSGGY